MREQAITKDQAVTGAQAVMRDQTATRSRVLLVSDLDGTLLGRDRQISEENRRAIVDFVEKGGIFTIATGRSFVGVEKFLEALPINAPAILFNGAVIYDFQKEQLLYESTLDEEIADLLENLHSLFPEMGMEIFNREDIYLIRENDVTVEHRKRQPFSDRTFPIRGVPDPWYKALLAWEPEKLAGVERYLDGLNKPFHYLYTEKDMIEIVGLNTSKGIALEKLAALVGCEASEVIAMGDNLNDLDMIEKAGTGIAVENAHDRVKAAASLCCRHHDRHAVSQVIGWIQDNLVSEEKTWGKFG